MKKDRVQEVLAALPDDIDLDALMEKLYLLRKIELAEEELAEGRGIAHEDAKKRLAKWLA